MMPELSPWDGISVPGADFNVRQVAGSALVPCFWGRDSSGACLFVVELEGDHTEQYRKSVTTVKGIDVDLRAGGDSQQRLVLTLEKQVDRDLFEGLCQTLASALVHASDSAGAVAIALAHLRRWKTFLSGGGAHLSSEEVRGLFAELMFLLELLEALSSSRIAIDSWLGSESAQQDFTFRNTAVEIKSLAGTERNVVRISSEDQLQSLQDLLFLRIYRLSNLPEADEALSLNDAVEKVHSSLSEAEPLETFDRKLVLRGYAPLPEYDQPRFVVSDIRSFRVVEGFPRIVRSTLPLGITNVSYDTRLESISSFECDNEAVFRGG